MKRLKRPLWIFDIGGRRDGTDVEAGWYGPVKIFFPLAFLLPIAEVLGLPQHWPLLVVGCLDLLATKHFAGRSVLRIRRMGLLGPTRARWWIEAAALVWILCMSVGVFAVERGQAAFVQRNRGLFSVFEVAMWTTGVLIALFYAMTITGYGVGLVQRKPIRGRAVELVNFFFWGMTIVLGIVAAAIFLPPNLFLGNWVAPLLAILSLAVLLVAGVVAVWNRRRRQPEHPTV